MARRSRFRQVVFSRRRYRRTTTNRPSSFGSFYRRLRIEPLEDRRLLSITVNTLIDVNANDGLTTLREAITAAPSGETIDFSVSGMINLSSLGHISINKSLTINGPGANLLTVKAFDPTPATKNGDGFRIFSIDDGNSLVERTVTISGLNLTGGDVTGNGGAISSLEELVLNSSTISGNAATGTGSGIFDLGTFTFTPHGHLTVNGSTISGNISHNNGAGISTRYAIVQVNNSTISGNIGGGILNATGNMTLTSSAISGNSGSSGIEHYQGNLTVISSTISGNSGGGGAGILLYDGNLTVTSSTISGNSTSASDGGGIRFSNGNFTITASTINGNSAHDGGGMHIALSTGQTGTIVNSTISGNSADEGGGLDIEGGVTIIRYSTITENTARAGFGAGVAASSYDAPTRTEVHSTIIAGNHGTDVDTFFNGGASNSFQSSGYNLIGTGDTLVVFNQTGDQTGVLNPMLDSLANNGGPTATHALAGGSPAIDSGDPAAVAGVGDVPLYDQRQAPFTRVTGRIDIGAFEAETATFIVDTLADESDGDYSTNDFSLREAIELANVATAAVTIQFDPSLYGGTITLTQGELLSTRSVFIDGPGAKLLTVDASGNDPTPEQDNGDGSRVFRITDGNLSLRNIWIDGITITGADLTGSGGAIRSLENLTLTEVIIANNHSTILGGGIVSGPGNLHVIASTISGNSAAIGGGVWCYTDLLATPTTTITNSTISGNTATIRGGGVYTRYGLTVIRHSTITNNTAPAGQGSGVATYGGTLARTEVHSSIIAGNTNSDVDFTNGPANTFQSNDFNLIGTGNALADFNQPGDQTGVTNPMLGAIADNGGPTMTHALLPASPAIDRGDPVAIGGLGDVPQYDQRGNPFTRVQGGRIDIGAFELQPLPAVFFGDYNQNGEVDAADYVVWRKTLGTNVAAYSSADGDGDGVIDQDDYGVWRAHFGETLPPPGAGSGAVISSAALAEPTAHKGNVEDGVASGEGTSGEKQAASQRLNPMPVLASASSLFGPYRPTIRSSLGAQRAISASRRDESLLAWLVSQPGAKEQFEDSLAAETWECEDMRWADDLHMESVEQVFAQLAGN